MSSCTGPCAGIQLASDHSSFLPSFLPSFFLYTFSASRGFLADHSWEDAAGLCASPLSLLISCLSRMSGSVLMGGHCPSLYSLSPSSSFPLLADVWQCAYWRTLPFSLHHPSHSSRLSRMIDHVFSERSCHHIHLTNCLIISSQGLFHASRSRLHG